MTTVTRLPLTLPLSEVFGPTWQGEGPHTGRRVGFVRLGQCNLTCEWCDTPYTWDRTRYDVDAECPPTRVDDIAAAIDSLGVDTMVLSGGEPLLHAKNTEACALGLLLQRTRGMEWHVETNGTIPPPPWMWRLIDHATVSPKINTRDPERRRLPTRALASWAQHARDHRAAFKFVCATDTDVDTAHTLCESLGIPPHAVWIMPEGTDPDTILGTQRDIAPRVRHHGYNLTTRLHVLLWGDRRGV